MVKDIEREDWAIWKEDEIYWRLGNQIVIFSVKEFHKYLGRIQRGVSDDFTEIERIIEFYKSDWFKCLTNVSPRIALNMVSSDLEDLIEQYQQDIDLDKFKKDPHTIERARKIVTKATDCLKSI